jgi:hypothetical protein
MIAPPNAAPNRPNSGPYGDSDPSGSSAGPIRVPAIAPTTKPPTDSAPTTNPWRQPIEAMSAAKATIPQSSAVTKWQTL